MLSAAEDDTVNRICIPSLLLSCVLPGLVIIGISTQLESDEPLSGTSDSCNVFNRCDQSLRKSGFKNKTDFCRTVTRGPRTLALPCLSLAHHHPSGAARQHFQRGSPHCRCYPEHMAKRLRAAADETSASAPPPPPLPPSLLPLSLLHSSPPPPPDTWASFLSHPRLKRPLAPPPSALNLDPPG